MRLTAVSPFLASVFAASGTLAQTLTAEPTSGTPDITLPSDGAFVFCSAPDCAGTCAAVDSSTVPRDDTHPAPNDMSFESMYWYFPYTSGSNTFLYTCPDQCQGTTPVAIPDPNTCYTLYNNSVPAEFDTYYYI